MAKSYVVVTMRRLASLGGVNHHIQNMYADMCSVVFKPHLKKMVSITDHILI